MQRKNNSPVESTETQSLRKALRLKASGGTTECRLAGYQKIPCAYRLQRK